MVAAVVHGELLALRAFGTVDGLVARAAARLVLVDRGLDPKAVSAPEVGYAELDAAGRGAHGQAAPTMDLRRDGARLRHGGPAGSLRGWCTAPEAVALGAREGVAVCEAIKRTA